jgi:hypothetical protein
VHTTSLEGFAPAPAQAASGRSVPAEFWQTTVRVALPEQLQADGVPNTHDPSKQICVLHEREPVGLVPVQSPSDTGVWAPFCVCLQT